MRFTKRATLAVAVLALAALLVAGFLMGMGSQTAAQPANRVEIQVRTFFNASAYDEPRYSTYRSPRADLPNGTPARNATLWVSVPSSVESSGIGVADGDSEDIMSPRQALRSPGFTVTGRQSEFSDDDNGVPSDPGDYPYLLAPDGNVTLSLAEGTPVVFRIRGFLADPPEDCRAAYRSHAQEVRAEPARNPYPGLGIFAFEDDAVVEIPFVVQCVPHRTA